MKRTRIRKVEQEAIGIVISSATPPEPAPRVSAYVWGPAPESTEEPGNPQAA